MGRCPVPLAIHPTSLLEAVISGAEWGKRALTAPLLRFTAAHVSRSHHKLCVGTAEDPSTCPLPPALFLQQRCFGRGEDGQLRAAASLQYSYQTSAKRVLTYHYCWCSCYYYYCYHYISPYNSTQKKPNLCYFIQQPFPHHPQTSPIISTDVTLENMMQVFNPFGRAFENWTPRHHTAIM